MKISDLAVEFMGTKQLENPVEERTVDQFKVTTVEESDLQISSQTNRYTSIAHPDLSVDLIEDFTALETIIQDEVVKLLPTPLGKGCLIGLGNLWMTPDALGPRVIQKLQQQYLFLQQETAFLLQPGVSIQSGMETKDYIYSIVQQMKPDYVIAIDSLKATSQSRLCRLLQITNAGIKPGSGMQSDRQQLNEATLGIPVIAIGVPTVISSLDVTWQQLEYALQHFMNRLEVKTSKNPLASVSFWQAETKDLSPLESIFGQWAVMNAEERQQFIHENAGHFNTIVTETNIHEWIERWSEAITHALMKVLTPTLST